MWVGLLLFTPLLVTSLAATPVSELPPVEVRQQAHAITIENKFVSVSFDLEKGTYQATDKQRNALLLEEGSLRCAGMAEGQEALQQFSAKTPGAVHSFQVLPLGDSLGLGRSLLVASQIPAGPRLLLRISLYRQFGFVSFAAGLENTTNKRIQVKELVPVDNAVLFRGADLTANYATLDGYSGGAKTYVEHQPGRRTSLNNLLATFGRPGSNRSLVLGGLSYEEFEKYAEVERLTDSLKASLSARDPIGKRVDPGTRYLVAQDRFYLDFLTDNPFEALETYAEHVRLAQGVVLPVCSFPIIDTWFAQVPHFGGGALAPNDPTPYISKKPIDPAFVVSNRQGQFDYYAKNDSVGAVEEMECVARSGFLKYCGRMGILLEPDVYASEKDPNTQQLWWDDLHWQRGPNNRVKGAPGWSSSHGQFVPPYETARKWVSAVRALGGVPMIYLQTGFRSQDYAQQFPGHMVFNQPDAPCLTETGEQQYRDREKKEPRQLGPDYTDPDFIAHVREVWENLRQVGLQGVKFDYPDYAFTGWPTSGGLEDPYATTAMHYRNVFKLARDGLGPEAFVHERALSRGSDVTLGLSTSQRTEGDTDLIDPSQVSRVGLRWYKNRVVLNYDLDGKNPFHVSPLNRDGVRAMLTMSYVVSGTLIVVPSVGRWTTEMFYDLGRIYPFHAERKSARPVDAFSSKYPSVYDYKVNDDWHQITFYNTSAQEPARGGKNSPADSATGRRPQIPGGREMTVGVGLAGDTAFGGLGLDPKREYYVYDFWNDRLLGKFSGSARLEQTLRPGEARMMSVRAVQPVPQFLSSNRHAMQGLVDHLGCEWHADKQELRGVSLAVGDETYRAILACNGWKPVSARVDDTIDQSLAKSRVGALSHPVTARVSPLPGTIGLAELKLDRPDNGPVAWTITFAPEKSAALSK